MTLILPIVLLVGVLITIAAIAHKRLLEIEDEQRSANVDARRIEGAHMPAPTISDSSTVAGSSSNAHVSHSPVHGHHSGGGHAEGGGNGGGGHDH